MIVRCTETIGVTTNPQFKILWPIIGLDAVLVVHLLPRHQVSTESFLHNESVFRDISTPTRMSCRTKKQDIAFRTKNPSAFPLPMFWSASFQSVSNNEWHGISAKVPFGSMSSFRHRRCSSASAFAVPRRNLFWLRHIKPIGMAAQARMVPTEESCRRFSRQFCLWQNAAAPACAFGRHVSSHSNMNHLLDQG